MGRTSFNSFMFDKSIGYLLLLSNYIPMSDPSPADKSFMSSIPLMPLLRENIQREQVEDAKDADAVMDP